MKRENKTTNYSIALKKRRTSSGFPLEFTKVDFELRRQACIDHMRQPKIGFRVYEQGESQ